jgi:hypothetical protein
MPCWGCSIVIFHQHMLHSSQHPNRSQQVRWALDFRYQIATESTLRLTQGHLCRSQAHPEMVRTVYSVPQPIQPYAPTAGPYARVGSHINAHTHQSDDGTQQSPNDTSHSPRATVTVPDTSHTLQRVGSPGVA